MGQGALAVECRAGDEPTLALLSPLRHRATLLACAAERAFMRKLEGGCSAPVAAHAHLNGDILSIDGGVWSLNGEQTRRDSVETKIPEDNKDNSVVEMERLAGWKEAEEAGLLLAEKLLGVGAGQILEEAKKGNQ